MLPKLGVVAGGGDLPKRLIAAGQAQGRAVFVVAIEGAADAATVLNLPHCWARLDAVGRIVAALRNAGVEEVVLAGRVHRPSWTAVRPDWRGLKLLAKVMRARGQGDNSVLALAMAELESEGFRVIGAHDLLADLIAQEGPIGRLLPDESAKRDIARGLAVARALGQVDVGQAVVIQQGIVLGVEAAEGTDALLERCGPLKRDGPGGVLVKRRKPGQDRRADLPTIGPTTAVKAAQAGLRGIAVEAGGTLVLDPVAVARIADDSGLFVIGVGT